MLEDCRVARFFIVYDTKTGNWAQNVPKGHKISQMAVNYSKWPHVNIQTFSNLRASKIYPNWYFWFENKPSGNPGWLQTIMCEWIPNESRLDSHSVNDVMSMISVFIGWFIRIPASYLVIKAEHWCLLTLSCDTSSCGLEFFRHGLSYANKRLSLLRVKDSVARFFLVLHTKMDQCWTIFGEWCFSKKTIKIFLHKVALFYSNDK
jgi:hypothetical protein